MIIQLDTDKARECMIPLPDLATLRKLYPQLVSDEVLAAAGAVKKGRGYAVPLSSLRFTGGSAAEIEASARPYAARAGVKVEAVPSFFRFNTKALRSRTVPFGEAALAYFAAAAAADAVYSPERGGIVRAPSKKAPSKARRSVESKRKKALGAAKKRATAKRAAK